MIYKLNENPLNIDIELLGSNIEISSEEEKKEIEIIFPKLTNAAIGERFNITFSNNCLKLKEKKKKKFSLLNIKIIKDNIDNKILLKIPKNHEKELNISEKGGNINFSNEFQGKINFKILGGNVTASKITSKNLKFKLLGGNMDIDNLDGSLKGKILGGNLSILDGKINNLEIQILGGNAEITSELFLKKDSKLSTLGGNLDLNIKKYETEKEIHLKKLGGNIDIIGQFPNEKIIENGPGKNSHKKYGKKFHKKFYKHHNNDFNFEFSGLENLGEQLTGAFSGLKEMFKANSEVKKDFSDKKSDNSSETSKILEMLEDGKITADQAEKLIKATK